MTNILNKTKINQLVLFIRILFPTFVADKTQKLWFLQQDIIIIIFTYLRWADDVMPKSQMINS